MSNPTFKPGDKVKSRTGKIYTVVKLADNGDINVTWDDIHPSLVSHNAKNYFPSRDFTLIKEPLKLEVGKFYKTRDGRKARIDAILPEDHDKYYRVIGLIYDSISCTRWQSWSTTGDFPHDEDALDIVDVWTDPPPKPRTGEGVVCIDYLNGQINTGLVGHEKSAPFRIRWEEIIDGSDKLS